MVRIQIPAGRMGRLVEAESLVGIEGWGNATQPATFCAIRAQPRINSHGDLLSTGDKAKTRRPPVACDGRPSGEIPNVRASLSAGYDDRQPCNRHSSLGTIATNKSRGIQMSTVAFLGLGKMGS